MLATQVSTIGTTRQMSSKRRTIINLQQRYNVTGTILDHPRAGRPKVTTIGQDRQMTLTTDVDTARHRKVRRLNTDIIANRIETLTNRSGTNQTIRWTRSK